jgi:uncharacterized Rmd1/YagE family protein
MSAPSERTALLKQFASAIGSGTPETRLPPSQTSFQAGASGAPAAGTLPTPNEIKLDLSQPAALGAGTTGPAHVSGPVAPSAAGGGVGNPSGAAPTPTMPLPRKTGLRHRARLEREEPLREKAALGFVGRLSTYCTCTTYDLRALYAALQQITSKANLTVRRLSRDLLLLQRRPSRRRIGAIRELLRSGEDARGSRLPCGNDRSGDEHTEMLPTTASPPNDQQNRAGLARQRMNRTMDPSWRTMDAEEALDPSFALDDDQEVEDVVAGAAIFFFSYGTLVCWGLSEAGEWGILDWLQAFENGQLSPAEMEKEFFTYTYSYEADKARIKNDNIMLPGALVERSQLVGMRIAAPPAAILDPNAEAENEWTQLEEADLSDEELVQVQAGISHALAQSCKLGSFENSVDLLIERCGNVPLDLVRFGELRLGARDVMRMSGEVHLYRSYFNLQTDLLGTPDWFWENEEVEPLYERTARWLDTEKRGQLLNQRLEILKDLFMLFRDEVHVRTEHRLEWIIIILIVAEVLLQLLAMALGAAQSTA